MLLRGRPRKHRLWEIPEVVKDLRPENPENPGDATYMRLRDVIADKLPCAWLNPACFLALKLGFDCCLDFRVLWWVCPYGWFMHRLGL